MLKPRPSIAALNPYQSPISTRAGLSLDLNENMAGCSPRVLARLRALTMEEVARYPQRETGEQLVANFLGVAPEQVLLTNGMDDALSLLFATYLSDGCEIILADPTFVMYPMLGQAFGAHLVRVPAREDFSLPASEILARISPRTRVIPIANPNNPTGAVAASADLLRITQAAPHAAVLIDEAYFEFHGETLISELPRYPNLCVARTFSKAYGLAGLRLGALIGPVDQISFIRRFCPPFNVNVAALACLEAALADQAFVQDYVAEIKRGREQIVSLCRELGLQFWPSAASFVMIRVGKSATVFAETVRQHGIIIRDLSDHPASAGCVRITVPAANEMARVVLAVREALTKTCL